jgi:hypothetical protein
MEPRREEQQKALAPSAGQKPKRFRIVKLEERIAPSKAGGTGTGAGGTRHCPTVANTCRPMCGY